MKYLIDKRENISPDYLEGMHKLRASVFKDKKGWDVSIIADMEIDGYDALAPSYMLLIDDHNENKVAGCWRILPTTGPYMLKDTFPSLLTTKNPPRATNVWELSRFAINSGDRGGFGFSDTAMQAIGHLIRHAHSQHIEKLITVTSVGVEKMLMRAGLELVRLGPPLTIGVERAIAVEVNLSDRTLDAVNGV
ncbi:MULTISPECIES: acyl-homoserine-lactone synthase [Pseudomonas fluorescens group]|uniref:Acyl-homoserine-lactone synthase n=1 Tax=Pseudomonas fluorescens TaxID=294 RepID=A0AAE2Q3G6_PSEFL|nr:MULTISPECIES: acyl-homoserine-lactone synthase [Pseudomonas fluorescens group]MBA1429375.1 GNAT family N-acetyltransferase [Pseudomonas orientalis]MBD8273044.1 GNAT family N-acetyltransferase [Pseudomonas fluorescens]